MPLMSKHRRIFSVTSSLQYRFLAMTLIYGFIIVSFFIIAVIGPDISEMRNESLSQEIRSSAAYRVLGKSTWIWPTTLILIAMLGIHSFFEFQRVMGPLYRFQWAFKQVEKGHLPSAVTTRKGDYLIGELAALNKMIDALAERINTIKQESEALLKSMAELESSIDTGSEGGTAITGLLQAHRQHVDRLTNAVRFFRLQDTPQDTASAPQEASEQRNERYEETKNGPSQITSA